MLKIINVLWIASDNCGKHFLTDLIIFFPPICLLLVNIFYCQLVFYIKSISHCHALIIKFNFAFLMSDFPFFGFWHAHVIILTISLQIKFLHSKTVTFVCAASSCQRNYHRHSQTPAFIGKLTTYTPKVLPAKFPKSRKLPSTCPHRLAAWLTKLPRQNWLQDPRVLLGSSGFFRVLGEKCEKSKMWKKILERFSILCHAVVSFRPTTVGVCFTIYVYNLPAKIKIVFLWRVLGFEAQRASDNFPMQ